METSDSEYFESADEDLQSDEEDTKTVNNLTNSNESNGTECINAAISELKDLKLTDKHAQARSTTSVGINEDNDNRKVDKLGKDDENNVSTSTGNKKDVGKKLGTKVGKSIDNIIKRDDAKPDEEEKKELVIKDDNIETNTATIIPAIKESEANEKRGHIKENEEENLWEDDEVDWSKEKEGNMWDNDDWEPVEESHQRKQQEENLWKEDEIDWHKEKEKNMWDNNDWEAVEESHERKQPQEKLSSVNAVWSSWGNWGGVSSILSTASQSVSSITQGITTALETGIGVPEPEELARINKAEKEKLKEVSPPKDDKSSSFVLGNFVMGVSHLTKLVETTSTKVISGGLDTLETIGKKTMEVLQEGDPGLKKKRAFLKIDQEKPVLSQLLREAKEKAENENKILEQKHFARKAKNYETLFDDHQGLVHLEALEMLSKQCDIKLQTLLESYTGDSLTDMQETMDQVKELSELPDEDEDEQANWDEIVEKLNSAVSEINIPISYKKLIETWEETEAWLKNLKLEICDERELHQQGVETLAQLTAIAVEQFHKAGELLLVKEHRSTADEADSLVQLTSSLTSLIGLVAGKFSDKLNTKSSTSKNKEEINALITNVFFEAANSSSYIQDAFQLLIPVLQVGAV